MISMEDINMSNQTNQVQAGSSSNLPVKTDDDFLAITEVMDLSKLKDKQFIVGVSTGDPDKGKFVCTTLHGPYDFYEMVEEVGTMWNEHQHHAKAYILEKTRDVRPSYLGKNTVDYIETHYADLITEGMLEGVFDEQKEYTCQAEILVDDGEKSILYDKEAAPVEKDEDEE